MQRQTNMLNLFVEFSAKFSFFSPKDFVPDSLKCVVYQFTWVSCGVFVRQCIGETERHFNTLVLLMSIFSGQKFTHF